MNKTVKIIFGAIVLLVVGTGIFLTLADVSVPTKEVERKIDNSRFE